MTTLRDIKTGELHKIRTCKYCTDYSGKPKPIMPNDMDMQKQPNGSYKCGECITTDIRKNMIKTLGYDSPRVKEFLYEEQNSVDNWNSYARNVNESNRRMGGTKDIFPMKRNKYLT